MPDSVAVMKPFCIEHRETQCKIAENNLLTKEVHAAMLGDFQHPGILHELREINRKLDDGHTRMDELDSRLDEQEKWQTEVEPFVKGSIAASRELARGMLGNVWRVFPWLVAFFLGYIAVRFHGEIPK